MSETVKKNNEDRPAMTHTGDGVGGVGSDADESLNALIKHIEKERIWANVMALRIVIPGVILFLLFLVGLPTMFVISAAATYAVISFLLLREFPRRMSENNAAITSLIK